MALRLLLPELLAARGWTVYRLIREAGARPVNGRLVGGRLDASWAYRITRKGGHFDNIPRERLETLADVLDVDVGDLFEPAPRRHR